MLGGASKPVLGLGLLVTILATASCGSSSNGGSVDQSSLSSVANAWAGAFQVNGVDSATLLAIRNPRCPRAQYERYLKSVNQRATDLNKLTPSERKRQEQGLPSNLQPVMAFSSASGRGAQKLVPLPDVPASARTVTVHWGPTKLSVKTLKQTPPVTEPFVLVNGKWYDGGCPFLSPAKQAQLLRGG